MEICYNAVCPHCLKIHYISSKGNKMKTKKIPVRYMLAAAAFVGITVTAILFSCDVYRIVPLYVSLVVMIFL